MIDGGSWIGYKAWLSLKLLSFVVPQPSREKSTVGGISDRHQEIKRRRHRRKKIALFKRKLKTANASEKTEIVEKLRKLTEGCEVVIENLGLTQA